MKNKYFILVNTYDTYFYKIENEKATEYFLDFDGEKISSVSNLRQAKLSPKDFVHSYYYKNSDKDLYITFPINENKPCYGIYIGDHPFFIETFLEIVENIQDENIELTGVDVCASFSDSLLEGIQQNLLKDKIYFKGFFDINRVIYFFFHNYKQYKKIDEEWTYIFFYDDAISFIEDNFVYTSIEKKEEIEHVISSILVEKYPFLKNIPDETLSKISFHIRKSILLEKENISLDYQDYEILLNKEECQKIKETIHKRQLEKINTFPKNKNTIVIDLAFFSSTRTLFDEYLKENPQFKVINFTYLIPFISHFIKINTRFMTDCRSKYAFVESSATLVAYELCSYVDKTCKKDIKNALDYVFSNIDETLVFKQR